MIITAIIFVVILLILVLSHEAGHFFSARFFGIRVEEFGFGLPPRVFGIKSKTTLYSLNALPFGGFVKIFGEEGDDTSSDESFASKSGLIRSAVLTGGVLANILVSYLIFVWISALGVPVAVDEKEAETENGIFVMVTDVAAGSPAFFADIRQGDKVHEIGLKELKTKPHGVDDVQNFILAHKSEEVNITLQRGEKFLDTRITPRDNPPEGEGPLGIGLALIKIKKSSWYLAPWDGFKLTVVAVKSTVLGFYDIISNFIEKQAPKIEVSGPVGIFNLVSSTRMMGFNVFLMFVAILSINLAIINLLPIPGLDGGRFLFVMIESVRGRRISVKTSSLIHGAGLAFLIALMLIITYKDISRLF